MEETALVILLLSGLSTASAEFNRNYHFVNLKMTWTEAQRYCREKFTDLATVHNDDDNQRLLTLARNTPDRKLEKGWIGLYDDINSWKWSMEDKSFHVDRDSHIITWRQNQPNNLNGNQHCVIYYVEKNLNDENCKNKRSFICYDASSTTSYVVLAEKRTWPEARAYCRKHHTDLVSIRSKEENNKVQLALKKSAVRVAFVGLYREPWSSWSDNSNSTFTNWKTGQPVLKHYCAKFGTDSGKWMSGNCVNEKPFFCSKDTKLTTLKIRIHTKADINNLEIKQQVLQQLHTHMVSKGLTNFEIHWKRVQRYHENHREEEEEEEEDAEGDCTDKLRLD